MIYFSTFSSWIYRIIFVYMRILYDCIVCVYHMTYDCNIYIYIHMTFVYTQVNVSFNDFKKELHLQVQQGPCFSPLCFVGPSKKTSFYQVSWVLPGAAGVLGD